jgi:hypothetical protein
VTVHCRQRRLHNLSAIPATSRHEPRPQAVRQRHHSGPLRLGRTPMSPSIQPTAQPEHHEYHGYHAQSGARGFLASWSRPRSTPDSDIRSHRPRGSAIHGVAERSVCGSDVPALTKFEVPGPSVRAAHIRQCGRQFGSIWVRQSSLRNNVWTRTNTNLGIGNAAATRQA